MPQPRDVLSGLVTGLFSIPEGMAHAVLGALTTAVERGRERIAGRPFGSP